MERPRLSGRGRSRLRFKPSDIPSQHSIWLLCRQSSAYGQLQPYYQPPLHAYLTVMCLFALSLYGLITSSTHRYRHQTHPPLICDTLFITRIICSNVSFVTNDLINGLLKLLNLPQIPTDYAKITSFAILHGRTL